MFDFKAIPLHLKNMLIHAWLLPYWYLALYLFSPTIYNKQEIILTSCICLSITLTSALITSVMTGIIEVENDKSKHIFDFDNVILGFFVQLIILSILLFSGYLFYIFTGIKYRFYGFLLTYFISLIAFYLFMSTPEKGSDSKQNTLSKQKEK